MGSSNGGSFTSCCGMRPESETGQSNLYSGSSVHNRRVFEKSSIKLSKIKSEGSPTKRRISSR